MNELSERFEYLRKSAGLQRAIIQLIRRILRPVYYRDKFFISMRDLNHDTRERLGPPPHKQVGGRVVATPAELDEVEVVMNPYVVRQDLPAFLAGGSHRYAVLTERTDEDGAASIIGFRKMERGRFMIYDYGFGGDLPNSFVMNQDSGIAPEFRGLRLHNATRGIGHDYAEQIGVRYTVNVIRSHNEASLKQGARAVGGTERHFFGPFEIRSWLRGVKTSAPPWSEIRAMLLEAAGARAEDPTDANHGRGSQLTGKS